MNSKTAKLINRFSKTDIVMDARYDAVRSNPKKVIKRTYKKQDTATRIKYKNYMRAQINNSRGDNVEEV